MKINNKNHCNNVVNKLENGSDMVYSDGIGTPIIVIELVSFVVVSRRIILAKRFYMKEKPPLLYNWKSSVKGELAVEL